MPPDILTIVGAQSIQQSAKEQDLSECVLLDLGGDMVTIIMTAV